MRVGGGPRRLPPAKTFMIVPAEQALIYTQEDPADEAAMKRVDPYLKATRKALKP